MNNIPIEEMPREIDRLLDENERIIKSANDTMMKLNQIILELHKEIDKLKNIINKGINECEKSAHDIWKVEGAYSNWFLEIKDILKGSE